MKNWRIFVQELENRIMEKELIIKKSKVKITFTFVFSLVFIVGSCLVFYNGLEYNDKIQIVLGSLTFVIFTMLAWFMLKYVLDKGPALILNSFGIDMSFGKNPIGVIEWKDVDGFEIYKSIFSKMVLIKLNDNDKYMNRSTNFIIRKLMKASIQTHGSPLALSQYLYDLNIVLIEEKLREMMTLHYQSPDEVY